MSFLSTYQINISSDFIVLECLILKIAIRVAVLNFNKMLLSEFRLEIRTEFPITSEIGPSGAFTICTTYLSGVVFSALVIIKSKYSSILKKPEVVCPLVSNVQQ